MPQTQSHFIIFLRIFFQTKIFSFDVCVTLKSHDVLVSNLQ